MQEILHKIRNKISTKFRNMVVFFTVNSPYPYAQSPNWNTNDAICL